MSKHLSKQTPKSNKVPSPRPLDFRLAPYNSHSKHMSHPCHDLCKPLELSKICIPYWDQWWIILGIWAQILCKSRLGLPLIHQFDKLGSPQWQWQWFSHLNASSHCSYVGIKRDWKHSLGPLIFSFISSHVSLIGSGDHVLASMKLKFCTGTSFMFLYHHQNDDDH